MPTVFPNSMSYLQYREMMSAKEKGYLSTALWGQDLMALLPIQTPNDWMQDIQFKRVQPTSRRSGVRLINEAPDVVNSQRLARDVELLAIYGTENTSVDKVLLEKDPTIMDLQMGWALKDLMRNMNYDLVNSTPTADGRGIVGLKARCPIGDKYDFNTTANGGPGTPINVATGAGLLKLLQLIRSAHDEMHQSPGTKIVMIGNRFIGQAISAGADSLGQNFTGAINYAESIFERRLLHIDGIPFLPMRGDSTGLETFAFDEPNATTPANLTSSIMFVAYDGSINEDSAKIPEGAYILAEPQADGGILRKDVQILQKQVVANDEMNIGLRAPERSLARISNLINK